MKDITSPVYKTCAILAITGLLLGGCSAQQKKGSTAKADVVDQSQQMSERQRQEIQRLQSNLEQTESTLATERANRMELEERLSGAQMAKSAAGTELLPPNAKPGECYARVFVPPTYKTETQTVLKREAHERFEVIPAQYQWKEETVMVKEPSERLEVVPAQYKWVEENVLVRPASKRIEEIPAVYKTVQERVLDKPEHTVWKKGTGPITKIDETTGEIMCLVTVPATYKTVSKQVLVTPATTRSIEIPAEFKTVKKQVMVSPPTTRKIAIPGEYSTVKKRELVRDAETRAIPVKAEYESITKRIKTSDGHVEWRPVLCQTNMNERIGRDIQSALQKAGFNPGPIDGIIGQQTRAAITSFQKSKGLPTGGITMRTLDALGIKI